MLLFLGRLIDLVNGYEAAAAAGSGRAGQQLGGEEEGKVGQGRALVYRELRQQQTRSCRFAPSQGQAFEYVSIISRQHATGSPAVSWPCFGNVG